MMFDKLIDFGQLRGQSRRFSDQIFNVYSRKLEALESTGIFNGEDPLSENINIFLVQVVIIMGFIRVIAIIFKYFSYWRQPLVVYQIVGGVLLGPTALSKNSRFREIVFREDSLIVLEVVSNFGLILYVFLLGMELDFDKLITHTRKAAAVTVFGMVLPFLLGVAVSLLLYETFQADDPVYRNVHFTTFFTFIGTAFAFTAFPVLAKILKESGLIYSRAGALVLGAAALNDLLAWCLLFLSISLANPQQRFQGYEFGLIIGGAFFILVIFRKFFEKLVFFLESFKSNFIRRNLFTATLILAFMCAWCTSLLGLSFIFGSFIFGLAVPRKTRLFHECNAFLEEFVLLVTLPIFFALSGFRTDLSELRTPREGALIVLVCIVATLGKVIGAGGGAMMTGVSIRESCAIGILMNTRGTVELIVLNVGFSAGILNTKTFTVMVVMTFFTTVLTNPLISFIYPENLRIREGEGLPEPGDDEDTSKSIGDDEKKDRAAPVAYLSIETDVIKVAQSCRIGLVVDRLEHLQGIMDLMTCLRPLKADSELSVTVMNFEEPSFTEKDQFLGLTEDRLISVSSESTDIRALLYPTASRPPPRLLPLSMFVKTLGASIKVFDIKGDPLEFPSELKKLASSSSNDLVILPWRQSQFLERFLWGTLRRAVCPIALFVQCDADVPCNPEGRDQRANSIYESGDSQRNLADYQSFNFRGTESFLTSTLPPNIRNSLRAILPVITYHNSHVKFSEEKEAHAVICKVVALITGSLADISIICVLLRLLENPQVKVTLYLCDGSSSFPQPLNQAFKVFFQATESCENIIITKLQNIHACDTDCLAKEITKQAFDLFLHSYIENDILTPPITSDEGNKQIHVNVLSKSASGNETDSLAFRKAIGVPDAALHSGLKHPELGSLGDRMLSDALIPFHLVFHEPLHTARRRKSLNGGRGDSDGKGFHSSPSYASLFGDEDDIINFNNSWKKRVGSVCVNVKPQFTAVDRSLVQSSLAEDGSTCVTNNRNYDYDQISNTDRTMGPCDDNDDYMIGVDING